MLFIELNSTLTNKICTHNFDGGPCSVSWWFDRLQHDDPSLTNFYDLVKDKSINLGQNPRVCANGTSNWFRSWYQISVMGGKSCLTRCILKNVIKLRDKWIKLIWVRTHVFVRMALRTGLDLGIKSVWWVAIVVLLGVSWKMPLNSEISESSCFCCVVVRWLV